MSRTVQIVVIVAVTVLTFRLHSPTAALAAYKAELRAKGEKLSAEELGFPRPPEASGNLALLLASVSQLGPASRHLQVTWQIRFRWASSVTSAKVPSWLL